MRTKRTKFTEIKVGLKIMWQDIGAAGPAAAFASRREGSMDKIDISFAQSSGTELEHACINCQLLTSKLRQKTS